MASASRPRGDRVRDAERTRAELLQVAGEVFSEYGLSGARVDEIAERTRTTKRMIYYYFGGKEQLYRAVLEEAYRGIRQAEQSISTRDADPVDAVREVAEATFDHHHSHPAFIRLVMIENIHRAAHLRQVDSLRELATPAVSLLADILARGQAGGDFRTDVDALDVHMVISSYCVFQVANRPTFGFLFERDMREEAVKARHRAIIGDLVVGWLTSI